jgi:hypothetical protein
MRHFNLLSLIALLFCCHSKEDKKTVQAPGVIHDSARKLSFFDSIEKKYDLSIEQIRTHTNINSLFYNDLYNRATFAGDTVLQMHNGITGVIMTYSDGRNCSKKLFLTFLAGSVANSDYKWIKTDCDRDFSGNYFYTVIKYSMTPAWKR